MLMHVQIDFGIVEENAAENKLHLRRVSQGMTIHVPQGESRRRLYAKALASRTHCRTFPHSPARPLAILRRRH